MTPEFDEVRARAVVAAARRWIGTPYRHQASQRGRGCDCLGLVRGVWREVMGTEPEAPPPYSRDGTENGTAETLAAAAGRHLIPVPTQRATVGDVLLFRLRPQGPARHCAILVAPGTMVHAASGHAVRAEALTPQWRRRMAFAFRIPPSSPKEA